MWSGLGSVEVRFGLGLVRLGLGPVKDGLCSFRICSRGKNFINKFRRFWQSVVAAVSLHGQQSVVVYHGTVVWSIVFMTTMIARLMVQLPI